VLSAADILELQDLVRQVPVAEHVLRHATTLARMTRRGRPGVPDFVNEYVAWGAGPRASQHLVLAAKARALLSGRPSATRADVEAVAAPVLRHRVLVNYKGVAVGVSPVGIIGKLLSALPRPAGDSRAAAHLEGVMGG
jgi:MoxR-like ATPase